MMRNHGRAAGFSLVRASSILALLAAASPAQGSSGVTVGDDFADAALNAMLWSTEGSSGGGTVTQTAGYLEVASPEGQDLAIADVKSLVALSGDFDVTVDYQAVSLSNYWSSAGLFLASCDDQYNMNIYLSRSAQSNFIESTYLVGGVQQVPPGYWTAAGADMAGKFRIARSGSTFTSYYWRSGAWQRLVTAPVFAGPAKIQLFLLSNNLGTPGAAPAAVFRWDNVLAQSQGATGCPY